MPRGFKVIMDGDDTTLARRLDYRRYHIIDLTDLRNATDEATWKEWDGCYLVKLVEVDLDIMTEKQIDNVKGQFSDDEEYEDDVIASESARYGYGAPMFDQVSSNRSALLKLAKAESRRLQNDPEYYEQQMNRPVNQIGSTAREFGQGDTQSAMFRGIRQDKTDAKLVGKIQGLSEDNIKEIQNAPLKNGFRISIHRVPSNDPIAYTTGYRDAICGFGKFEEKLADAYLEGYRKGVAVKAGEEPLPDWHQSQSKEAL